MGPSCELDMNVCWLSEFHLPEALAAIVIESADRPCTGYGNMLINYCRNHALTTTHARGSGEIGFTNREYPRPLLSGRRIKEKDSACPEACGESKGMMVHRGLT